MTRAELEFYSHNVPAIRKALERIADALENQNQFVVNTIKGQKAQDKVVDKAVDRILDNGIDFTPHQIDEDEQLDIQHDYLHGLVQDMDNDDYLEFCNEHCLPASDTVAVSNYITDLDYDEVLDAIKDIESQNDLRMRYDSTYKISYRNKTKKSDDQANEDAIEAQNDYPNGVTYDDDYDLRVTAKMYTSELEAGNFRYKKDAILDYVTNEFGSQGARYTDIIKFAYYLNNVNSPKFGYDNRGYYSCAMTHNRWGFGHLVTGGKDHFVKGINKDGKERYFALSFVESATDYWKKVI